MTKKAQTSNGLINTHDRKINKTKEKRETIKYTHDNSVKKNKKKEDVIAGSQYSVQLCCF